MHRWLALALVAGCGKSSPPASSGSGSGSSVAPTRFPACAITPSITAIPPAPFKLEVPRRSGELLVVGSRGKQRRYATYDPAKRAWSELPPLVLEGSTDILPFSAATKSQLLLTYEKGAKSGAFALDLGTRTWSAVAPIASPYNSQFLHAVGDTILVVPYRPCGFQQYQLAHTLDRTPKFVGAPSTLAPRARPHEEVVDGKLVVWGGDVIPDAPATGDIGCDHEKKQYKPTGDGAIFDPVAATWTAMAPGPLDATQYDAAPGQLYANAKSKLWRYELAKDEWKQLGDLPAEFSRALSKDEAFHVATIGKAVGGHYAIVHSSIHGGREVLVDRATGAMKELPAPALDISEAVVVDDKRLLLLPRGLSKLVATPSPHVKAPDPVGYLHDVTTGSWCELPWSAPHRFDWSAVERFGPKLVLWDFEAGGIEVTIP